MPRFLLSPRALLNTPRSRRESRLSPRSGSPLASPRLASADVPSANSSSPREEKVDADVALEYGEDETTPAEGMLAFRVRAVTLEHSAIFDPNAALVQSNDKAIDRESSRESDAVDQSEYRRLLPDAANGKVPQVPTALDGAKLPSSVRWPFAGFILAAFVAGAVFATVSHASRFGGVAPEPADNMTRRRIPLVLPHGLFSFHRNYATHNVNRSTAKGLLQGIAQDIEQETRARAISEWTSQGGLIDVPVRDVGPQCKQGSHNCEWEVISAMGVPVHRRPNSTAPILAEKQPGSVVVGREENGAWLRLAGEVGFMAFEIDGSKVLKQREDIWYEKIVHGRCVDAGRHPILDGRSCEVAALTLGLAVVGPFDKPLRVQIDSANGSALQEDPAINGSALQEDPAIMEEVSRRMSEGTWQETGNSSAAAEENASALTENTTETPWDDGSRPEGCYMDGTGVLRMNLHPGNIGNGVLGDMQPICATMAYPSTHTTTSTTHTGTTTTRSYGWPSFTCFSYMRPWTPEEALIKQQMAHGAGIFACDHTVVISSMMRHLGKNQYGRDVWTWKNPPPTNQMGNLATPGTTTNSWLNSLTFIIAFDTIINDSEGRIWSTDFFVKADPDAILLPDRLQQHVKAHVGAPVYFLNCGQGGGAKLYGAIEIYSKEAMRLYKDGHDRCANELNWHGWGEDMFFSSCFNLLGAQGVADVKLVGDSRCNGAPCTDPWRAAFHPFKDLSGWLYCWRQATNIWD